MLTRWIYNPYEVSLTCQLWIRVWLTCASHFATLTAANSLLLELPVHALGPCGSCSLLFPHSKIKKKKKSPTSALITGFSQTFWFVLAVWTNIWRWFVFEEAGSHSHTNTQTANWVHMTEVSEALADFNGYAKWSQGTGFLWKCGKGTEESGSLLQDGNQKMLWGSHINRQCIDTFESYELVKIKTKPWPKQELIPGPCTTKLGEHQILTWFDKT